MVVAAAAEAAEAAPAAPAAPAVVAVAAPVEAAGGGGGPTTYQLATVAQMRQGAPGSYELDNVVAIALTSSVSSPRVFFQDAGGGDFSAMAGNCCIDEPDSSV